MNNTYYLHKDSEGVVIPAYHNLTSYFDENPDELTKAKQVQASFRSLRNSLKSMKVKSSREDVLDRVFKEYGEEGLNLFLKSEKVKSNLQDDNNAQKAYQMLDLRIAEMAETNTRAREAQLQEVFKLYGSRGLDFYKKAEEIDNRLIDREKSLVIASALCSKHQKMLQDEDIAFIRAYPLIDLHKDCVVGGCEYSESTIRRFVQNTGLKLVYKHYEWDAEELTPRSERGLIKYLVVNKLNIDIGRTSKEKISKLLKEKFGINAGSSNMRFLQQYI